MASSIDSFNSFFATSLVDQILEYLHFNGPSKGSILSQELDCNLNYLYKRLYFLVKDGRVRQFKRKNNSLYYVATNPLYFDDLGVPCVSTENLTVYDQFILWAVERTETVGGFESRDYCAKFKRKQGTFTNYLTRLKQDGFLVVMKRNQRNKKRRRYRLYKQGVNF
jgi:hypothetical protein